MSLRVGLVGAGGVGRKRAAAVSADPRTQLRAVCDVVEERAHEVAADGARVGTHWREVVEADDLDLIIVSTTHDLLSQISAAALTAGKHVLCEKPLGRTAAEASTAVEAAAAAGRILHAGYNHRFHPAIEGLREAALAGKLGELMNLRGRYGHGARPGYETEWRADARISGGGELLDQGAHLIDLSGWLLGPADQVNGRIQTAFWDIAPVEDNAFALLTTPTRQTACLHVSWTQWKNLFSVELFGTDGYGLVEGLGGSYGQQRLTIGRRRQEGGVPEERTVAFSEPDRSWNGEWDAFLRAIEGEMTAAADGAAGVATLECIEALYRSAAREGSVETIGRPGKFP